MKLAINSTWSFRDFIEKCVIHQFETRGVSGMNEHYCPQSVSGASCDVTYNFIGKFVQPHRQPCSIGHAKEKFTDFDKQIVFIRLEIYLGEIC